MEQKTTGNKNAQRITSPAELHDVMRVSSPRVWIILIVITALLLALIVVAATRTLENTMDIKVTVQTITAPDGGGETAEGAQIRRILGSVALDRMNLVNTGMTVRFSNVTGKIGMLTKNETEDAAVIEIIPDSEPVLLPDGIYDGKLVLETTTPIRFLLN